MLGVFKATLRPGLHPSMPPWKTLPPSEIAGATRFYGRPSHAKLAALLRKMLAVFICDDSHWIKISSSGLAEFNRISRLLKKSAADTDEA